MHSRDKATTIKAEQKDGPVFMDPKQLPGKPMHNYVRECIVCFPYLTKENISIDSPSPACEHKLDVCRRCIRETRLHIRLQQVSGIISTGLVLARTLTM